MAVVSMPLKPLVEVLDELEVAGARVVLAAAEHGAPPVGELAGAVAHLATVLWELQETRARARAIAHEVGTPPLYVVEL